MPKNIIIQTEQITIQTYSTTCTVQSPAYNAHILIIITSLKRVTYYICEQAWQFLQ